MLQPRDTQLVLQCWGWKNKHQADGPWSQSWGCGLSSHAAGAWSVNVDTFLLFSTLNRVNEWRLFEYNHTLSTHTSWKTSPTADTSRLKRAAAWHPNAPVCSVEPSGAARWLDIHRHRGTRGGILFLRQTHLRCERSLTNKQEGRSRWSDASESVVLISSE